MPPGTLPSGVMRNQGRPRSWASIAALIASLALSAPIAGDELSRSDRDFFEARVRPLLIDNCYGCHSEEAGKRKGGLLLDRREGWARGGDSGPAAVPGRPQESLLLEAVSYENPDLQMPPRGKLSGAQFATLREWIARGAPDPRDAPAAAAEDAESIDIEALRREHWSWQPIDRPTVPTVDATDWPRDPLDPFVLRRLEDAGLSPADPAPGRVWLRRVSFDLIGLPPSPDAVAAIGRDDSPAARAAIVDELLESPHFGEKWAQHWLDLVRFAETRGHEQDFPIPHAWRYRDYAIRAFNADVPYDRFLMEHLAGDLLPQPRIDPDTRTNQSVQGTGFWHLGEATHSPVDIRGDEADRVANQIDVFSRTFLGLSMGCARCHDHKFDPISARDYYAFYGYLQSSSYRHANVADPAARARARQDLAETRERIEQEARRFEGERQAERARRLGDYLRGVTSLARGEPVSQVAGELDLDAQRLESWRDEVERARKEIEHVLHPVARLMETETPEAFATERRRIVDERERHAAESARAFRSRPLSVTVEKGERNFVRTERPLEESDRVVDYSQPGSEDWLTAGHAFGDGPLEAGELVLSDNPARPVERIAVEAEATSGQLSDRLTGFLRTRTFEVTSDTLWYRYRGAAEVFLAVDSHRMVAGPLHGVVKQKLQPADTWRWQAHNVRDYIGHRVHVEFTPAGKFALREVRFYQGEPPPVYRDSVTLREALEAPQVRDVATLIDAWASAFERAAAALRDGREGTGRVDRDLARLNRYLLENAGALDIEGEAARREELARRLGPLLQHKKRAEERIPEPIWALALLDGSGEDEPLHLRGNHRLRTGDRVPRGILTALRESGESGPRPPRGSGRLELARELVADDNPLVARVIVNRVWHHLFSRGIVPSVDDFGVMGEPPTHPDLLDHLASTFRDDGWSLKRLIRRIVLSSTYGMSSQRDARAIERDPKNDLLHHVPVKRLTGEAIRDALLAVSGQLDPKMYGPSVSVHITPFMRGNRSPGHSGPVDGERRRSIYTEVRRNHLPHFLTTFDRPTPFATIGRRSVSNSPAQSLILLNDPLVHQQAEGWARRLLALPELDDARRIDRAYLEAFARQPTASEQRACKGFLKDAGARPDDPEATLAAWKALGHTLFNVKEFIFLN